MGDFKGLIVLRFLAATRERSQLEVVFLHLAVDDKSGSGLWLLSLLTLQ